MSDGRPDQRSSPTMGSADPSHRSLRQMECESPSKMEKTTPRGRGRSKKPEAQIYVPPSRRRQSGNAQGTPPSHSSSLTSDRIVGSHLREEASTVLEKGHTDPTSEEEKSIHSGHRDIPGNGSDLPNVGFSVDSSFVRPRDEAGSSDSCSAADDYWSRKEVAQIASQNRPEEFYGRGTGVVENNATQPESQDTLVHGLEEMSVRDKDQLPHSRNAICASDTLLKEDSNGSSDNGAGDGNRTERTKKPTMDVYVPKARRKAATEYCGCGKLLTPSGRDTFGKDVCTYCSGGDLASAAKPEDASSVVVPLEDDSRLDNLRRLDLCKPDSPVVLEHTSTCAKSNDGALLSGQLSDNPNMSFAPLDASSPYYNPKSDRLQEKDTSIDPSFIGLSHCHSDETQPSYGAADVAGASTMQLEAGSLIGSDCAAGNQTPSGSQRTGDPEPGLDSAVAYSEPCEAEGTTGLEGAVDPKSSDQELSSEVVKASSAGADGTVCLESSERGTTEPCGGGDEEEEEDEEEDWETMFDDSGDCLDPDTQKELDEPVGKTKASKPTLDYWSSPSSKKESTKDVALDYELYSHVIEIYDFPRDFTYKDVAMFFKEYQKSGFDVHWVDDTHCLGIFSSRTMAEQAMRRDNLMLRTRPLAQASRVSKVRAKERCETLLPVKARPETSSVVARRLVSGALGLGAPRVPAAQRERERQQLRDAKEKKKKDKKQAEDIWEGRCAMDRE